VIAAGGRPEETPPPLRRLLGILRPDRRDLAAVVVFAFAIGGLLLATPVAVQALVNFVSFGGATTPILALTLLLLFGLGLAALLSAVETWIVEILQRRMFVRVVTELVHRISRMDPRFQQRWYGPERVNRFLDVVTLQKMTSFLLLDGLGIVLAVVLGMLVLAFYHPILLAFDLVILVVVAGIVLGLGRSGIPTAIRESKAKYAVAGWLEEVARQRVTFRHPGAREYLTRRLDTLASDYVLSRRRHYAVLFRQILGTLGLQVAASVALLGLGGWLVVRGELTLGQLVAAELIVSYVVGSVAKMGKHLEAFYDLMGASDKLGILLDLPMERDGRESWSADPPEAGSSLRVIDAGQTLSSERRLLDGVAFELQPGERLAVTGSSGSGKTTLLETIYGLRLPDSGTIQVDGFDARTLHVDALRERIALAARPEVFEGSIRDNVTLGRELPDETVHAALRCAGLLEELLALPDGLETTLLGHGVPLSDGQLARLMIARAVAGRPRLLLVDGLLDGLGAGDAAAILDTLLDPAAPWTLIVATQRAELLERFRRVVDLDAAPHRSRLEAAG
jgi:ABC-type bacteriocin/lantibiotic exporter with double-glycine peptidase domain